MFHSHADLARQYLPLKVPKCETFILLFFTQSNPIWVGDLGNRQKNLSLITYKATRRHFIPKAYAQQKLKGTA